MPILKLGKNGIPYEDSGHGHKNNPDYVEDDNMLKMSLVEDEKTLKDRQALKKLRARDNYNKIIKYAKNLKKKKAIEAKKKAQAEKEYLESKKRKYIENLQKSSKIYNAIRKGYNQEPLSGVSGYGLSDDGRNTVHYSHSGSEKKPYPLFPAHDYKWILDASEAFGNLPEEQEWTEHLGAEGSEAPEKVEECDLASFTEKDEFILKQWFGNVFSYNAVNKSNPKYSKSVVFNLALKKTIDRFNKYNNGIEEIAKAQRRGWMYSGFHENGKWVSVKVPFIYGVPMDFPSNPNTHKRDGWRKRSLLDSSLTGTFFDSLKPVICALASYYNHKKSLDKNYIEPVKEANRIEVLDVSPLTYSDNQLIKKFDNNSLSLPFRKVMSGRIEKSSIIFDYKVRSNIKSLNVDILGAGEYEKISRRGWAYSGYHDKNGDWVTVKVPFIYGLPLYSETPKSKEKLEKFIKGDSQYTYTYSADSYFDIMKPLILAFAKAYKYLYAKDAKIYSQEQSVVDVDSSEFRTSEDKSGKTKIKVGDFRHPMAKYELLK